MAHKGGAMGLDQGFMDKRQGLRISRWTLARPLDPQLGQPDKRHLPDELIPILFDPAGTSPSHHTYALLDGAKVAGLADMLRASGLEHRCLFKGKPASDLREVAPWIVRLTPEARLTRNLFTSGRMPGALWDRQPGVFLRSRGTLDEMWNYLRKFTRMRDQNGMWFYVRYWDPACFDLTADLLLQADAGLHSRPACPVELIVIRPEGAPPAAGQGGPAAPFVGALA